MSERLDNVQQSLDSFVVQVANEANKKRHAEKQLSGGQFLALYVWDETGYGKLCLYNAMRPCDISPRDDQGQQVIVFNCDGSQVEITGQHIGMLMKLLGLQAIAEIYVGLEIPIMGEIVKIHSVNITHLGEASEDD